MIVVFYNLQIDISNRVAFPNNYLQIKKVVEKFTII